jgi:hypothetical protein
MASAGDVVKYEKVFGEESMCLFKVRLKSKR